jgi:predicted RNase H-like HicB family nuclease
MTKKFDRTFWKGKATDVAFTSPFSESTNKIRGKLLLFSSLAILNYYFPLDFNNSQIFGVKFKDGDALSLSGIFSFLVIYFSVILIVHTYQEIQAWLAQANSLEFAQSRVNLHNVYAHHQSIQNAIIGANEQLELHTKESNELNKLLKEHNNIDKDEAAKQLNRLELHKQSFENYCSSLGKSNEPFGQEIEKAIELHRQSFKNYKSAMFSQYCKVGILEILLPFTVAIIAILLSYEGMVLLFHGL